jgi:hypothetical protein
MPKSGDNSSRCGYAAGVMSASKLAVRIAVLGALALALGACARGCGEKPVAVKAPPPPPPPPPPAPEPPKPPPPTSADDLPPLKTVEGDGISIALAADGRVKLKTTALWNEPLEQVYDDCDYYLKALPVLRRQVSKDRAKLLDAMCVPEKAKPKPSKAKKKP